jgi:HD-like signal output (HDOD) protein
MQTAREAKQQILTLQRLPPLSATAARLLESLSNEDLSLQSLAEIIGQDPGVSARIVGVANSAYFAQAKPILSVEEAIIRVLGLDMVKSLAISIAINDVFNTSKCREFDLEEYWFQSLATAMLSREICRHLDTDFQSDLDGVYLAGLLFNIGTLVLVHLFPDAYADVIRQSGDSPEEDCKLLQERIIGINSQQAGAWLTDRWHLPLMVVRVVAQSAMVTARCEVAAVTLSNALIKSVDLQKGEMPAVPAALTGLTDEELARIYESCRYRDDELHSIVGYMAK